MRNGSARAGSAWVAWLVLSAGVGCGDDGEAGLCDPVQLEAALAGASAGDVVRIGDCEVEGSFVVPRGAALEGTGDGSAIRADGRDPAAVRLLPSGDAVGTRVARVRIHTGTALVGVRARGAGAVRLEGVVIEAAAGIGVALSELDRAVLSDVTVRGGVPDDREVVRDPVFTRVAPAVPEGLEPGTAEECAGVTARCEPATSIEQVCTEGRVCGPYPGYCDPCGRPVTVLATVGIFTDRVGELTVTSTDVRGVGQVGAFMLGEPGDRATWTAGDVGGGLGLGIYTSDVDFEAVDVEVSDLHQGFRAEQAIGVGFLSSEGSGAGLRTTRLGLVGNEGYGAIQRGGVAAHTDLGAGTNTRPALWVGEATGLALTGGRIEGNDCAGLVVVDSSDVSIEGLAVENVRERMTTVGASGSTGTITWGDGLHLVRTRDRVALSNVSLVGNARAGLLLEVGLETGVGSDICASGAGVCFDAVTVDAPTGGVGALAVSSPDADEAAVWSGTPIGNGAWDTGIVRRGAALGDGAFANALDAVGVIAPLDFPRPDGIIGVIAPLD